MSESGTEQRPLLCDEFPEDEPYEFSPHLRRHMGYRTRARNNIKGAAAIIKNWPDHWTTSISYWWVIFGMISISIFIIYNSILYATLPTVHSKLIKKHPSLDTLKDSKLPEIFIHIFANSEKEADLNKYLPYIEIVAKKHFNYKFNLIVLFNDTSQIDKIDDQAQLNNDVALNSLWAVDNIDELETTSSSKFNNIVIRRMNLSSCLNESPLRKYWKRIPHQFIEFLVRAVSIWEKGGIALNPIILTPRSPNSIYIEKLHNLMQIYQEPKLNITRNIDSNFQKIMHKHDRTDHKRKSQQKQVNNIRDIIDAMNTENSSQSEPATLSEAESKQFLMKVDIKPYFSNLLITNKDNVNRTEGIKNHGNMINNTEINPTTVVVDNEGTHKINITEKPHFLPSIFDLLFRDKSVYEATTKHAPKRSSRNAPVEKTSNALDQNNIIQPMIIPAPTVFVKFAETDIKNKIMTIDEYEYSLSIDLKGNLISTRIPCHAFIGSLFNNVKHCTGEESLKDFIITELSKFCKGLLSTCKGIDVILL